MTKIFGLLFVSIMAMQGALAATTRISYQCGKTTKLDIIFQGNEVQIFQQFPKQNGHGLISVYSDPVKNPSVENDSEIQKSTGMNSYVTFAGFHYPNGEMLVAAEQDTNEEGYGLYLDASILKGAKNIQAAEEYWSDFHDSLPYKFTCVRIH